MTTAAQAGRAKGRALSRRARAGARPRILLLDPDPYLGLLVAQHAPDATVADSADGGDPFDVVVVDLDGPAGQAFAAEPRPMPVIGITAGSADEARRYGGVDHVLVRPFLPGEIADVLARALRRAARKRREAPTIEGIRFAVGVGRVSGVLLAALIRAFGGGVMPYRPMVLAAAFAYATLRMAGRPSRAWSIFFDISIATVLLAATGGTASVYAPLALVLAIAAAVEVPRAAGGLLGLAVALGALPGAAVRGTSPFEPLNTSLWLALFGLAGFAASMIGSRAGSDDGMRMLEEANRLLGSLYRLARAMPGALDVRAIAESVMSEVQDAMRAPAAAFVMGQGGTATVAGSYGFTDPHVLAEHSASIVALVERGTRVLGAEELPDELRQSLSFPCFVVALLRRSSGDRGFVIAACAEHGRHERDRAFLREVCAEAAIATENANLFGRVRELAIDEERRRVARELHDGVAQALTHLRLELHLLSRTAPSDEARGDLTRLSKVVEVASADVRDVIAGLRTPAESGGLAASLDPYLRDLGESCGIEIGLSTMGWTRPGPDVESELFRFAQDAVTDAIQRAHVSRIRVELSLGAHETKLAVVDNGVPAEGRHQSVADMDERARSIGGRVSRTTTPGAHGMRVEIVCPIDGRRST